MPDGVANLTQTRHTTPARRGKAGSSSARGGAHRTRRRPFPGNHPHDNLVHKKASCGPFMVPCRPSRFEVPKPSIPSVCNNRFRACLMAAFFNSQEVKGEF